MIIINGRDIEKGTLEYDSGFTYGRGVFETILIQESPLFLTQHCERLKEGLLKLGINNRVDEKSVIDTVNKIGLKNCVLKLIVTDKNIVMETRPVPYTKEKYKKGFNVKLSDLRRNPYSIVTYLKSLNYTDNILEREKALHEGFDEAIFLNHIGILTEGCISNIFLVKGERLFTPSVTCGLLNGIVRSWVMNNFEVIEGEFNVDELISCEGAFLTNSIMGIMRVNSFGGMEIQHSELTDRISNTYINFISA